MQAFGHFCLITNLKKMKLLQSLEFKEVYLLSIAPEKPLMSYVRIPRQQGGGITFDLASWQFA